VSFPPLFFPPPFALPTRRKADGSICRLSPPPLFSPQYSGGVSSVFVDHAFFFTPQQGRQRPSPFPMRGNPSLDSARLSEDRSLSARFCLSGTFSFFFFPSPLCPGPGLRNGRPNRARSALSLSSLLCRRRAIRFLSSPFPFPLWSGYFAIENRQGVEA